jgi:hypothetical protein
VGVHVCRYKMRSPVAATRLVLACVHVGLLMHVLSVEVWLARLKYHAAGAALFVVNQWHSLIFHIYVWRSPSMLTALTNARC